MPARGHQTPGLPKKGTKVQMPGPGAPPCLTEGARLAAYSVETPVPKSLEGAICANGVSAYLHKDRGIC